MSELRERIRKAREAQGITLDEMAFLCGCCSGLIRMLEEDDRNITMPQIAAKLLAECGIEDREALKQLTHPSRWNELPEIPERKNPNELAIYRIRRDKPYAPKKEIRTECEQTLSEQWQGLKLKCHHSLIEIDIVAIMTAMNDKKWSANRLSVEIGRSHNFMDHVFQRGTLTKGDTSRIAVALGLKIKDIVIEDE